MPALSDLRVLDLSRILAGPWCTQLLADFGAAVVKVEKPGSGDDTRRWGPPFLHAANGEDVAAYFLACNRGKRSIALDFTRAEGADLVRALAARADVLVENFRPGTLDRYGLDHATLHALNPRLVYCSISGFGQDGPNAQRAGYDAMIQAEAGLMSLTGEAGGAPVKVGVAVSDLMCGMYAASAILAALQARHTSGQGAYLDIPLFDTQVAWLANQGLNYLVGAEVPQRLGSAHPNIAPYQVFATADGHLMLAVGNDAQFRRFCDAAGCPRWPRMRASVTTPPAWRSARRWSSRWRRGCACAAHASGWMRWPRSTCPAARSTTLPRCSTIRRRAPTRWPSACRIRSSVRCRSLPTRCGATARRCAPRCRRRAWANTPRPCWPNWVWKRRVSPHCAPPA